jgi:hypothetical protein
MISLFERSRAATFYGITVTLLFMLSGCGEREKERRDEDIATIRVSVDGLRRCAALLLGELPFESRAEDMSGPRVNALVSAGLIRRLPIKNPLRDSPQVRVELTPFGLSHVMIDRSIGTKGYTRLCYGRQQLISIYQKKLVYQKQVNDGSVALSASQSTLFYDYKIVQPPEWTTRADIQAAFPFMVQDLDQLHTASQSDPSLPEPYPGNAFKP